MAELGFELGAVPEPSLLVTMLCRAHILYHYRGRRAVCDWVKERQNPGSSNYSEQQNAVLFSQDPQTREGESSILA